MIEKGSQRYYIIYLRLTRSFVDVVAIILLQTSTGKVIGFGLILLQGGSVCATTAFQKYLQSVFQTSVTSSQFEYVESQRFHRKTQFDQLEALILMMMRFLNEITWERRICTPAYLLSHENSLTAHPVPPMYTALSTTYFRKYSSSVARYSHAAAHNNSS